MTAARAGTLRGRLVGFVLSSGPLFSPDSRSPPHHVVDHTGPPLDAPLAQAPGCHSFARTPFPPASVKLLPSPSAMARGASPKDRPIPRRETMRLEAFKLSAELVLKLRLCSSPSPRTSPAHAATHGLSASSLLSISGQCLNPSSHMVVPICKEARE